jgi:hypothetical protein
MATSVPATDPNKLNFSALSLNDLPRKEENKADPNKLNFSTLSLNDLPRKEENKEEVRLQEKTSEAMKEALNQAKTIAGYLHGSNISLWPTSKWATYFGKFQCQEDHRRNSSFKIGSSGELTEIDNPPPCLGCSKAKQNIEEDPEGVKEIVRGIVNNIKATVYKTLTVSSLTFAHFRLRQGILRSSTDYVEKLVYGPVTFTEKELLKGREKISFYLLHNGTFWHVIVDSKANEGTVLLHDKNSMSMWDVSSQNLKTFREKDWDGAVVIADLSWAEVIPVPQV